VVTEKDLVRRLSPFCFVLAACGRSGVDAFDVESGGSAGALNGASSAAGAGGAASGGSAGSAAGDGASRGAGGSAARAGAGGGAGRGDASSGGASGDGGLAGAAGAEQRVLCESSRTIDPAMRMLVGVRGEELVQVRASGAIEVIDRSPSFTGLTPGRMLLRDGYLLVVADTVRFYAQSGVLLAEGNTAPSGRSFPRLAIHDDGSASVDFSHVTETTPPTVVDHSLLLRQDGTVVEFPYFDDDPDAYGWTVAESIPEIPPRLVNTVRLEIHTPVMEPERFSGAVHRGDHLVYVAHDGDQAVLVDQSSVLTRTMPLGPWPEGDVVSVHTPRDNGFVFVNVSYTPTWRYDFDSGMISELSPSVEPTKIIEASTAHDERWYLMTSDVTEGDEAAWSFDGRTGRVDAWVVNRPRGELSARFGEDWALVTQDRQPHTVVDRDDGRWQTFLPDDAGEKGWVTLVTDDLAIALRNGVPQTVIDLPNADSWQVPAGGLEPSVWPFARNGWAYGIGEEGPTFWVDGHGRVAGQYPPAPSGLSVAGNLSSFIMPGTINRDGALLYPAVEGDYAVRLLLAGPTDTTWRPVGVALRDILAVDTIAYREGFAVIGRTNAFSWIVPVWGALPVPFDDVASGPSLQILDRQGALLFDATSDGELLGPLPDSTESCLIVSDHIVVDLAAGKVHDLGELRLLQFVEP
jgi:hypothetical protein